MTDPANRPAFYKHKGRTLTEDFDGATLTEHGSKEEDWRDPPLAADDVDADVVIDLDIAILNKPRWAGRETDTPTEVPGQDDASLQVALSLNLSIQALHTWDDQQFKAFSAQDPWTGELADEDIKDKEHRMSFKAMKSQKSREGLNDDIMLLPGRVFGYLMRDRKWTCFDLGESASWKEVKEDDTARKEIQIYESHRRNLVALVSRHFRTRERRRADIDNHVDGFDIIQGKGRGLVILLHGAPGVGKTSTAESIAARFGKPLLPVTCGNLGTNVNRVEYELKEHFSLAERWKCIVLLDEANVFLARREKNDVDRNALVSIFLHTLEYFSGVLFLTTNRTGDFDEAFTSRIRVSLWYPDLDPETTKKIWQNDINRLINQHRVNPEAVKVEDGDQILRYAERHCEAYKILQRSPWNGRQIRNAFQTAVALAEFEAKESSSIAVLNWTHFRKVAIATNHFEGYLTETRGKTEDQLATEFALRAKFNAYAGIVGEDSPRVQEVRKWQKISLNKAHEFIKSIEPDKMVVPGDLFKKDVDESSFSRAVRGHKQSPSTNMAQQVYMPQQQSAMMPTGQMLAVPAQQMYYQPARPQTPTPSGAYPQGMAYTQPQVGVPQMASTQYQPSGSPFQGAMQPNGIYPQPGMAQAFQDLTFQAKAQT